MKAVVGEEALSSEDLVCFIFPLSFCFSFLLLSRNDVRILIKQHLFLMKYSYIWSSWTNSRGSLWHKEPMIHVIFSSHLI